MAHRDVIVIGGSAGAVEATAHLVAGLPPDLPCAIFIVVHFPSDSISVLPGILSRAGPLPAHHATDGEVIRTGRIYVAPPDCHMTIESGRVRVSRGPRENRARPAVDPLFRTAAAAYGPRVIGIVLSGNLGDGSAGLRRIREGGGLAIVQAPEDASHPGMPQNALNYAGADHVVALANIAGLILREAGAPVAEGSVMAEPKNRDELGNAEAARRRDDRHANPGMPSTQTCPECHGTLWETTEEALTHFRCRIGHSYTAESLILHQSEVLEAALWTALRALEEHAALARRLSAKALDQGRPHSAATFSEQAVDTEQHAAVLRRALDERRVDIASAVAS